MNERYSRQELFTRIGPEGQRLLGQKHALIIGAGALGAGSAEALVRAGVGKLTIVDRDYVEWSNLQRQQLYTEDDARQRLPKTVAAKQRLQAINSTIDIQAVVMDVTNRNIEQLAHDADIIMDATDNFEIRLLINDISQKLAIPWVYGSCVGSYGMTFTVVPKRTACLTCLLETVPIGGETCDTVGVIAPVVQMVIAYQTAEALKILVEDWKALRPKLVAFNLWTNEHSTITLQKLKREDCPSCGIAPHYPYLQASNLSRTAVLCGRDTVQISPPAPLQRNLTELASLLSQQDGTVEANPYLISFTIGEHRLAIFQDGRVLVHGTNDTAEARSLYHRYLG